MIIGRFVENKKSYLVWSDYLKFCICTTFKPQYLTLVLEYS